MASLYNPRNANPPSTQLALPGFVPMSSTSQKSEARAVAAKQTRMANHFMYFFSPYHKAGDSTEESMDKYLAHYAKRTALTSRDASFAIAYIMTYPINVIRCAGLTWGQKNTMPNPTLNGGRFLISVYYLALSLKERIRRREISLLLDKKQRVRILHEWATRYVSVWEEEWDYDHMLQRFTIAAISLNLSFDDIADQVGDNMRWYTETKTKTRRDDDFLEWIAYEATKYVPDFYAGHVDKTTMMMMLLEGVTK